MDETPKEKRGGGERRPAPVAIRLARRATSASPAPGEGGHVPGAAGRLGQSIAAKHMPKHLPASTRLAPDTARSMAARDTAAARPAELARQAAPKPAPADPATATGGGE